jgi:hypothetical protein
VEWCEALKRTYPSFSWRFGEAPNVSYHAERDRALMDVARITSDTGFKPRFGPRESQLDYLGWMLKNREFTLSSVVAGM